MKILELCCKFFNELKNKEICYCHWKSNYHLESALLGQTDLDILVQEDDKGKFEECINKFDFLLIQSPPEKKFPGLFDYLGFDENTGELIHLHVHYKLILGQKYIKNHHLPLENVFFDNLILSEYGVFIPTPELELYILIIRYLMKFDFVSILYYLKRKKIYPVAIREEFEGLIGAIDPGKMNKIYDVISLGLKSSFFVAFINDFIDNHNSIFKTLVRKKYILRKLKKFERHSGFRILFKKVKLDLKNFPLIRKLFAKSKRKKLPSKGKFFALIGADGSGKSTLIKDLNNWLSWKLDVETIYLGIPKEKKIRCVSKILKILEKVSIFSLHHIISSIRWIYIAKKREKIILKANRKCNNGTIILSDRFPLNEFFKMKEPMDGPRIKKEIGNDNKLSRLEEKIYSKFKLPNKIFVLNTSIEELRKRKTDISLCKHKEKAEVVNSIKMSKEVVVINGNQAYESVLLDIKKEIWKELLCK